MVKGLKSHLKKLDMPAKKAAPNDSEIEMELGDMGGEEAPEEAPEMNLEDMQAEEPSNEALASVGDEELLAEIKKRGLMSQLESPEEEANEGNEMPEEAPEEMNMDIEQMYAAKKKKGQ